ncbi:hypothetical protein LB505_006030 [Fusarium chuoi]|nr:hypothetical protein LB505_006030 [Fusarium chuoi]
MANTTSAPIVEIVPDGDIILVVGSDKKKLLVKSVLLMAVSKPFSVMLGPNWKEGHDMRYHHNGPFELTLPEDNATAMEIICSVIHFQNDRIPQILLASDVLAVAIAADKYDCMNALQFASRVWIREQKGKSEDLMLLTAAAYLFGDARAFKEATAALVLNHHGSYLTLAGEDAGSIMPWEVLYLLEEQRGFARLQLADILISGVNFGNCPGYCGWQDRYTHSYIKKLDAEDLWPAHLFNMSISRALEKADMMPDPVPREKGKPCSTARSHTDPNYRAFRNLRVERLKGEIGLCLECVQGGSNTFECM